MKQPVLLITKLKQQYKGHLKKSQKIRSANKQESKPKAKAIAMKRFGNVRHNLVITLLFLTCFFTIYMAATMPHGKLLPSLSMTKKSINHDAADATKRALAKRAPVFIIPKMHLDGVFLSNREKMAMIDNKAYHVGDVVKGMKLVSITLDQVQLKHKKQTLTLRNTFAQ